MLPLHNISNGVDVGDVSLLVNDRNIPLPERGIGRAWEGERGGGGGGRERERERERRERERERERERDEEIS